MFLTVLLFLIGFVFLIFGGDWFVDGASGIAHRFHMPEILIGATVVSIGTTLPEVMVSATSAVSGHGEMAYGNAIGSVICNTALIAAITITVCPSIIDRQSLGGPVIFFFITCIFFMAVAYLTGTFSRGTGLILLLIFVIYLIYSIRKALHTPGTRQPEVDTASTENGKSSTLARELFLLVIGAVLIAVGANFLVDNGTIIATAMGVPESVIALTFVALGTSLPELVTAISALIKGHGALSLGNVIGANLFNLALVCGISVTLSPFDVPRSKTLLGMNASLILDMPIMLAVMLILTLPALIRGKLSRVQGIILLFIYAAFCIIQFLF